ncbi:hypothetical protein [Ralstonia pseudosolanacearum]|uniref:hypothetical protein n=1 Tax=Ralstonia pseudosolanacearum TaxID=1310165 RepID=UPI0032218380
MKPVDPPTLRYAVGKGSLGHVLVATRGHGLCALLLGDDAKALRAALADAFPGATLIEATTLVSVLTEGQPAAL